MICCPRELLYDNDLILLTESEVDLEKKFQEWKQSLESKGLEVNLVKTKVLVSKKTGLYTIQVNGPALYIEKMQAVIPYDANYGHTSDSVCSQEF